MTFNENDVREVLDKDFSLVESPQDFIGNRDRRVVMSVPDSIRKKSFNHLEEMGGIAVILFLNAQRLSIGSLPDRLYKIEVPDSGVLAIYCTMVRESGNNFSEIKRTVIRPRPIGWYCRNFDLYKSELGVDYSNLFPEFNL